MIVSIEGMQHKGVRLAVVAMSTTSAISPAPRLTALTPPGRIIGCYMPPYLRIPVSEGMREIWPE